MKLATPEKSPPGNKPSTAISGSRRRRNCEHPRGFTLIEIMTVVTLIGILAGMMRLALQHASLRARGTAFVNDCRVFAEAFGRYALENGQYPPDQPFRRIMPPNMTGYLTKQQWLRVTPLGGDYDWDNKDADRAKTHKFSGAILVSGGNVPLEQLKQIDRWFDDGNITTGTIRVIDAGFTVLYVVEAK